jgi:hypothetical protein
MAKKDPPLKVEIPKAGDERPAWSKVGLIGAAGFVIGMAWPRLAGIHIGPNPPSDARPSTEASSSAEPAAPPASASAVAVPAPAPNASAQEPSGVRELVVVGSGKIIKCSDGKDKKFDGEECGELDFDRVAVPKIKDLAKCPSAMGLEGKLSIGFDVDFKSKEIKVVKGKKTTLPSTTVQGVLKCASDELGSVSLDDVPHKHRRYTVYYAATFYPPGKRPDEEPSDKAKDEGDDGKSDGSGGTATVTWDTALVRKEPKTGDIVTRAVKGTRVKILEKQNDWFKIEVASKTGWVNRGALGL